MSTVNIVLLSAAFALAVVSSALAESISGLIASGFERLGRRLTVRAGFALGLAGLGVVGVIAAALVIDAMSHEANKHPPMVCSFERGTTDRC